MNDLSAPLQNNDETILSKEDTLNITDIQENKEEIICNKIDEKEMPYHVVDMKGDLVEFDKKQNYPTRLQNVGKVTCLFISQYKGGQIPLMSLGPSRIAFVFLIAFVTGVTSFIGYQISSTYVGAKKSDHMLLYLTQICLLLFSILIFLHGIFGDPGIPPSIYIQQTTEKYFSLSNENKAEDGEQKPNKIQKWEAKILKENNDPFDYNQFAQMSNSKRLEFVKRPSLACAKCNLIRYNQGNRKNSTIQIEHCYLCDVCVMNCDHHCIFFSKCIGMGNVKSFYLSIVGFLANMVLMMVSTAAVGISPKQQ